MFLFSTNLTRRPLAIDSDLHNGLFTYAHLQYLLYDLHAENETQQQAAFGNLGGNSVAGTYYVRVYSSTVLLRYEPFHPTLSSKYPPEQGIIYTVKLTTSDKTTYCMYGYVSYALQQYNSSVIIRTWPITEGAGSSKTRYE